MGARYLEHAPPSDDYEIVDWRCVYHVNGFCHNPLDCDFIPLWALKVERRADYWAVQNVRDSVLIEAGGCTTCVHPEDEHTRESYGQFACAHEWGDRQRCTCAGFRRPS